MIAILHALLLTLINGAALALAGAVYTRWDDPTGEEMDLPNPRTPWWFDPVARPCSCDKGQFPPIQLRVHKSYSDFTLFQWECSNCGSTWCTYLEG